MPNRVAVRERMRTAELEQELKSFSYLVSHDLGACFRQVSGFADLVLAGAGQVEPERSRLEYLRLTAGRCQSMLDQLLTYSRVQQQPLAPTWHDAAMTLKFAVARTSALHSGDATISIEPVGEIYADPKLLSLAFEHLLDNAIKFRRPGVRPEVVVHPAHNARLWQIRFSDNGLGVEVAQREQAFVMFKRLHSSDISRALERDWPYVGASLAAMAGMYRSSTVTRGPASSSACPARSRPISTPRGLADHAHDPFPAGGR